MQPRGGLSFVSCSPRSSSEQKLTYFELLPNSHHDTPAARQQVRHDDNKKGKHDNSDGKSLKEVDRKLWKSTSKLHLRRV